MATTQTNTQITQLYVALFGRAPDVEGRDFWGQKLESGTSLSAIVEQMYGTSPARGFYPDGLTSEQIIGQFYKNVLGRTADAEGLAFWTEKLSASNGNIGDVLSNIVNVVTHYEGTDPAGLASASLFGNRADLASAFSDALAQAGIDGNNAAVLNISRSILDAVNSSSNVNSVIADTVGKAVSLTQLAIDKPEVVAALIPAGGKLSDLMASMPAGSDFADLLDFSNKLAGSATDAAAIEKLIPAGGDLGDFLEKLPANTTPEQLIDAAGKGPDAVGEVGSGTGGSGGGGGGGGGGGAPSPTFTVTNTGGVITFENGSGDITVTINGDNTVFTRGGVEKTVATSAITSKIAVASGQVLTGTAAVLTGKTIDGAGTVAVTALHSTAAADLSAISATTVTAASAGDVTFTGKFGKAAVTVSSDTLTIGATATMGTATFSVSSGAALEGSAANLTGKTINGDGAVTVDALAANTDLSGLAAGLQVMAKVGSTLDISANTKLSSVDDYLVHTGVTLTLTAEQASGKVINGLGGATITGLAADTVLSGIFTSGTVTGTVTESVDLTNVDLTKLTALTVGADGGDVVTATVTPEQYVYLQGKVTLGDNDVLSTGSAKAVVYSATTFTEAAANDGSISTSVTITLVGDTFTGNNNEALAGVTVSNVPAGLTAVVTKKTATTAEISFTGTASAHAHANDIANLEVVLADGAFTGGSASTVTGATKSDLVVDFKDPAPTISSVSAPNDATYKAGDALSFTVTFDQAVTVTGTPQLALTIGSEPKQASYVSGSGTSALVFTYAVEAGLTDADGIAVASPLGLNSGSIKGATGTDATLTLTPPTTTGVLVDSVAPTLSSSTPADDATAIAADANIVLTFSENVAAGTGDIVIKKVSDNSTVATIPVGDAQVTFSGTTVTINPTADLDGNTAYYVQISAGAIVDAAGNPYAGIADATTLNFTTVATFTAAEESGVITFGGSALGDITVTSDGTNLTFTRDGIAATPTVAITALADNTGIPALSGGDTLLMAEAVFDAVKAKLADGAATIGAVTTQQAAVTSHYAKIAAGGVTAITYADDAAAQAAAAAIASNAVANDSIALTNGAITSATATVLANLDKFKADQITAITLPADDVAASLSNDALKDGSVTITEALTAAAHLTAITAITGNLAKIKDGGIENIQLDAMAITYFTGANAVKLKDGAVTYAGGEITGVSNNALLAKFVPDTTWLVITGAADTSFTLAEADLAKFSSLQATGNGTVTVNDATGLTWLNKVSTAANSGLDGIIVTGVANTEFSLDWNALGKIKTLATSGTGKINISSAMIWQSNEAQVTAALNKLTADSGGIHVSSAGSVEISKTNLDKLTTLTTTGATSPITLTGAVPTDLAKLAAESYLNITGASDQNFTLTSAEMINMFKEHGYLQATGSGNINLTGASLSLLGDTGVAAIQQKLKVQSGKVNVDFATASFSSDNIDVSQFGTVTFNGAASVETKGILKANVAQVATWTVTDGDGDGWLVVKGAAADTDFGTVLQNVTLDHPTGSKVVAYFDSAVTLSGGNLTKVTHLELDGGAADVTLAYDYTGLNGIKGIQGNSWGGEWAKLTVNGDGNDNAIDLSGIEVSNAHQTTLTINGGVGNDTITAFAFLGGGSDTIIGGAGDDNITLGAGVDIVKFEATATDNGEDTITSFTAGTGGDVLDFSAFLGDSISLNDVVADDATSPQTVATGNILRVMDGSNDLDAAGIAGLFGGGSKAFGAVTANDKYVLITDAGKIWFIDTALDGNGANLTATDIVQVGTVGSVTLADLVINNFFA